MENQEKVPESKSKEKPKKTERPRSPPLVELWDAQPGEEVVEVTKFGQKFLMRPPRVKNPFHQILVRVGGMVPIAAPCAPNIDAWLAMLKARLNSKAITQEVYDRLIKERQQTQMGAVVDKATGEVDPDKAKDAVDEIVEANQNMFARDKDGHLVLEARAINAALRECLTEGKIFEANAGMSLREKFKHLTGIWPHLAKILRGDEPLTTADELITLSVHVKDKLGRPLNGIATFEQINPPWAVEFVVEVARLALLRPEHIEAAFGLLPTVGLGARRSQKMGRCKMVAISQPLSPEKAYATDLLFPASSLGSLLSSR